MQVPLEDNSTEQMVKAIQGVELLLKAGSTRKQITTHLELETRLGDFLKAFDRLGGGVARFRLKITKNIEQESMTDIIAEVERRCEECRLECIRGPDRVLNDFLSFIRGSSKVLVHGSGMLLAQTIVSALEVRKGVRFFITEGRPGDLAARLLERCRTMPNGFNLKEELTNACTVVPDSAVGALMPEMDVCLMGAMCVTEHGGLVHSTGSLQVATVAASTNVPCHVVCETFKFSHVFPLSTKDLKQPQGNGLVPAVEFVPPTLITFVFTEKGIMPPSAVADEMFRNHTTLTGSSGNLMSPAPSPASMS